MPSMPLMYYAIRTYRVAGKKRKCSKCGEMVPKGMPMEEIWYKRYPGSNYKDRQSTCAPCVSKSFEEVSPRVWGLFVLEKHIEQEGMIDA